jgi:hypothetical protein
MNADTKFRRLARVLPLPERSAAHFHGGVLGRVHLCDDPRCTASGRGSSRWGT